ncbi:MAG: AI-2E family transporter [Acidiferrobacterales bacterium]
MIESIRSTRGIPFIVTAASFVVVVAGMRAAEALIVPFLLSVFLAIISAPPLFWLERKGLPRPLAMLAVIGGIVGILFVMGAIVGSSVDGFSRNLPAYQSRVQQGTNALITWLNSYGIAVSQPELSKYLDAGAILGLAANTFNRLGAVLGNAFLIFLTVLFILFEASSFPVKLRAIFGDDDIGRFKTFIDVVKRYFAIKTWTSLATGLAVAVCLKLIGVDFPILWGLLAFLLNYIPNIGSVIAALPAVLLALVQLGFGSAIWTVIAYTAINVGIGTFIEPRFMGHRLGLSTLVVFISLVFWGWVLGPVGMFLSVPLTMTFKLAMESDDRTRWIAILLGSEASAREALPSRGETATLEAAGTETSKSSVEGPP